MDDPAQGRNAQSNRRQKRKPKTGFPVVGLGASAGGLQALKRFFEGMPAESGMSFVVIMHLSPEHESHAAAILQTTTRMSVTQVNAQVKVEPNHVYVIPPTKHLAMEDGHIRLSEPTRPTGRHVAVDLFFRTLADTHQTRAVCIVLSGTGADGSVGVKRVKEAGGLAIAQDPQDAEYDAMPRNAINTGMIDFVLPVVEMPEKLIELWRNMQRIQLPAEAEAPVVDESQATENALRDVLADVRAHTGHDFTHYKRATILRRIERRMQVNAVPDLPAYRDYLRAIPAEAQLLLKDLLIGVTNFFRDRAAFDSFEREVVPLLFEGKTTGDVVRVWCAGCATGEEAYSVVMLLLEHAARMPQPPDIQIFATDIDEEAIATARAGSYPEAIEADVPPTRLRQFFTKEPGGYRVNKDVRERILFAAHNLIKDPPFSKLDAVTCRNLLIYLNRDVQEQVFELFHFALRPGGFIFLGPSESVDGAPELFAPVSKKHRLFRAQAVARQARGIPSLPLEAPARKARGGAAGGSSIDAAERRRSAFGELHQQFVEQYAPPSLIVNAEYEIVHLSENVGRFLRRAGGEPSVNVVKEVLPELRLELRTALFQAMQTGRSTEARRVSLELEGHRVYVNMIVRPSRATEGETSYALVLFVETEEALGEQGKESPDGKQDALVSGLEEEAQRLKDQLQATIEQYETTVEELKSSNEEMQSVNEEVRSTSEELETSKEELQSVNEELRTVNQELKNKVEEVSDANADLKNLIASTEIATVFLDRSLRIKRYTPRATELFSLIPTDLGRPLADITHRLEYENLHRDAEEVIANLSKIEREVRAADNRFLIARFSPYRTLEDRIGGVVISFIDVTEREEAAQLVREERAYAEAIVETVREPLIVLDQDLRVVSASRSFYETFRVAPEETEKEFIYDLGNRQWDIPALRELLEDILPQKSQFQDFEVEHNFETIGRRTMLLNAREIRRGGGGRRLILLAISDNSERKRAEEALRENEERLSDALRAAEMGSWHANLVTGLGTRDANLNRILGYEAVETTQAIDDCFRLIHPDDKAAAVAAWQRAIDTRGIYETEFRLVREDGSKRWLREQGRFVAGEDGKPDFVTGLTTDITKRKEAEEELNASAERLQTIFEASRDGILVEEDERIIYVNQAYAYLFGYEANEELIGKHVSSVIAPEDTERLLEFGKSRMRGELPSSVYEFKGKRKDGTLIEVEASVSASTVAGRNLITTMIRDITERKRIETLFRAQKQALEMVVVGSPLDEVLKYLAGIVERQSAGSSIASILLLDEQGRLHNGASPSLPEDYIQAIEGIPADESVGTCSRAAAIGEIVITPDIAADPKWQDLKHLPLGLGLQAAWSMPMVAPDGRVLGTFGTYFREKREPTEFERQTVEILVGTAALAIERKQAEDALKQLNEQLEERVAERTVELMEMNTSLQAEISERRRVEQERAQILRRLVMAQEEERRRIARDMHDQFGQQLTALLLKLGMLKEDCRGQEKLCGQVESLESVAKQLDRDVDFLVWELRPTVLDDLGLREALANFAQNWSEHFGIPVEVHTSGMGKGRLTSETETVLYRIAQEALNNISKHARAESVSILLEQHTDFVSLIIEDDGVGFDDEELYGANDKGLGLVGMRERAALVGGTAKIESRPREGTTVIVRIPAPPVPMRGEPHE